MGALAQNWNHVAGALQQLAAEHGALPTAHAEAAEERAEAARKALGVKGFVAVKKGTPLYKKAKEFYGH